MLEVHRWRQIDWAPSAVVALATSVDGTVVAAARDNGSIELWNVAPGSVGWHCHLTIPGKEEAAISSLVWCKSGADQSTPLGRLFSAGLDGFITEWNLQTLQPKEMVESYGGSVWQLAAEPLEASRIGASVSNGTVHRKNGDASDNDESSSSDSESEEDEPDHDTVDQRIAVGCDDGCVRIFTVGDNQAGMIYRRAFPRVKGRILSVAWSTDASRIYAGGSDGCIRCWDSTNIRELFRITAGIGGRGAGSELCVWSLLALRNGTIVSGDSTGSTQFWEGEHGTLLQGHSRHKADVLALAAAPSHNIVFAAGADGQVTLYQTVGESREGAQHLPSEDKNPTVSDRWVYVGYKRSHTHDVKALALAYPVVQEEGQAEKPVKRRRSRSRFQMHNDYKKWAQPGIPMLISGGNDCKLFTYPAEAFLAFHPHDICHAPQRPQIQFAGDLRSSGLSVLMAQHSTWIDVWKMNTNRNAVADLELGYEFGKEVLGKRKFRDEANYVVGNPSKMNCTVERKPGPVHPITLQPISNGKASAYPSKQVASTRGVAPALLARIKCKTAEHIACSAISGNGKFVAFSDRLRPRLFQLEQQEVKVSDSSKARSTITKKKLLTSLPAAQCMLFTPDSTRLLLGSTEQILVVNVEDCEVLHSFKVSPPPSSGGLTGSLSPINFMCTSADSQWLAATTSSGYIHIFSLEALRHHWTVPVMDGTVATSAVFRPSSSNVLIISTAGNQLHVVDVEAKELTNWSVENGEVLSQRLLEFPGGIIGLSVPPNPVSTTVIAYGSRAMVQIDFSKPVKPYGHESKEKSHAHGNGNGAAPKQNGSSSVNNDNFAHVPFKNPVLFLGHTAQSSILVVEKPWLEVLRQIPAPVYRHLYGT